MRSLMLFATLLALNSCNTTIGMCRDVKRGYEWSKEKIQGTPADSGGDPYGSPVY